MAEADQCEAGADDGGDEVRLEVGVHLQRQGEILGDGQRVEQRAILEHYAESFRQRVTVFVLHCSCILAEHFDAAGSGLDQADDGLEQGALAAAAAAQDDGDFAAVDVGVDLLEDKEVVVAYLQAPDIYGAAHHFR